eukprot:9096452-Pyramimonas_sp.AAC.1
MDGKGRIMDGKGRSMDRKGNAGWMARGEVLTVSEEALTVNGTAWMVRGALWTVKGHTCRKAGCSAWIRFSVSRSRSLRAQQRSAAPGRCGNSNSNSMLLSVLRLICFVG